VEINPRKEKAKASLNQQRKQQEYQQLVQKWNKIKMVKQNVRRDKRNWINGMAGQAENSSSNWKCKRIIQDYKGAC
jgi:hypothetical protein